MRASRYPKTIWRKPRLPAKARAGVPTMVSVLVSAETMERLMAHQGAVRPPRK